MSLEFATGFELSAAIEHATRRAAIELFRSHPDHRFCYFSLITTGEAHSPRIAAWSEKALQEIVELAPDKVNARQWLECSYADSPLYCFGERHFAEVDELFNNRRPDISTVDWDDEYRLRVDAMESALARLDQEGVFGIGDVRDRIIINVEVMPPDRTNTERAIRLNPNSSILRRWLDEAAE